MNTKTPLLFIFLGIFILGYSQKIPLVKEQLLPLNHFDINADYGKLVDGVVGLDNDLTYTPSISTSIISWPHKILIDLRGTYNISQLKLYDGYSTPTINWYAGTTPFNTTLIAGPISMTKYDSYNIQDVAANGVRYLILEQIEPLSRFPSEIEVYGLAISTISPAIATTRPLVDVKQLLGADGFLWEDPNVVGTFTNYRLFTETSWFFDKNQKLMVSPANGGSANLKTQLTSFKNQGTESVLTLQNSPNYIMNKSATEHDKSYKPIAYNIEDYETPSNWTDIAQAYYRIAGYVGTKQILPEDLNMNTTPRWTDDIPNVSESGLDLVKYIEVLNEPDKNWTYPITTGYFSPYELASLMSAAYDGHQGTIEKAGIKIADPDLKVVMGGIYKLQVEYIKAMNEWAKVNRPDGKFPADVINFHHYNNNESTGLQDGSGTASINPEQGPLITQLEKVVDYRNKYLPNLEIWLSEWGYSTNIGVLQVPNLPSYGTKEDVQGAWLIRTYLTLMKLNIDKSHMYAAVDENDPNNNAHFGTCGIFKFNSLEKKRSYYYVSDFINLFKDYNYKLKSDLSTGSVRDYVFEDLEQNKEMRFVWKPSGNESTVSNYNVNISGASITGFKFTGEPHDIENYSTLNTITVTEVPQVYIYTPTILEKKRQRKKKYILYENPTHGEINLNFNASFISLMNKKGTLLEDFPMLESKTKIDITKYKRGIYILKIITENNKTIYKRIIKK